jgi:predicted transcriptional regulator
MIMITGPDFAGNVLEIGVVESSEYLAVIHAMKARREFLR